MIPRSLVLLAAVCFASTSRVESQTPKRELYEGNYGQYKRQELSKDVSPGIVYAKDFSEDLQELPPGHEVFGARSPPVSTISDLLAGAGTPFELAVANHLSSPVSIYQTRLASPPFKLVSQQPIQGSLAYTTQQFADRIRSQPKPNPSSQDLPNSAENELSRAPFTKLDFIAIGRQNQNSDLGRPRGFSLQNAEPQPITRVKPGFKEPLRQQFFPIEPQGPFKRPGQFIPAQYLQHQSLYQLIPVPQGPSYQEQKKPEQLVQDQHQQKSLAYEKPQSQNSEAIPQRGYHNHPNGAISFASFAHNLQNQQSNIAPQQIHRQPVNFITLQPSQPERQEQPQPQNYNQQLQNYQPQFSSNYFQYIPQNEPQPELLSSQPSLSFQPRYLNQQQLFLNPSFSLLQSIPAFKPLPQSILPNIKTDTNQKRLPEQNPVALNPQNANQDSVSHQTSTVSERSIIHAKSIQPLSYTGFLPTTLKPKAKTNYVLTSTINNIEKPKEEEPTQLSDEDQLLTVQPLVRTTVVNPNESSPHVTPRHLVTIQKQELQEITLPTFQPLKYARVLHAQDLIQHNLPKEIKQEYVLKTNEHNTQKYEENTQQIHVNANQKTDDNRQNSTNIEKDSENSQTKENVQQHESTSEKPHIFQDTQSKVKPIQLLYKLLQEKEFLNQNNSQKAEGNPINRQPSIQDSLPIRALPQFFTQSQELPQEQIPQEQLPQQLLSQQQLPRQQLSQPQSPHQALPNQEQSSHQNLSYQELTRQELPHQELPQPEEPQHELLHEEFPQQEFSSFGLPEYESVQYFGKYAQSLFGDYPR